MKTSAAVQAKAKKTLQWKEIKHSLRSQFKHKELRPGQEEIIRSVLAGRNTLGILPTGAGKSLCYQLPALQLTGTTVVVSPLISLMKDQREKVEENGIRAVALNSTLGAPETAENLDRVANADAEILYVTPERFAQPSFVKLLKKTPLDFVVVDEAHCVSQWGHDFRPAYLGIGETLRQLGNPPVLALTATATDEVAADIQKQLGLAEMNVFRSSVWRENLHFEARLLNDPEEKLTALGDLLEEMNHESGIVYVATVKAAEQVHEYLRNRGIPSLLYHGKLKGAEREASQNEFMHHSPRLMIATNAFGMGIDKSDIRFVMHFQFPGSVEAYYQEAGRAGRDGQPARCILLYLKRDKCTQSFFLAGKYPSAEDVGHVYRQLLASPAQPDWSPLEGVVPAKKIPVVVALLKQFKVVRALRGGGFRVIQDQLDTAALEDLAQVYVKRAERDKGKLNQIIAYAQSALCRWRNLRHYFNEEAPAEGCGLCDNCRAPGRRELHTRLVAEPLPAPDAFVLGAAAASG